MVFTKQNHIGTIVCLLHSIFKKIFAEINSSYMHCRNMRLCSKFLVVSYSIYGNFLIYEKGGLVRPVKQLIKLTWPYYILLALMVVAAAAVVPVVFRVSKTLLCVEFLDTTSCLITPLGPLRLNNTRAAMNVIF